MSARAEPRISPEQYLELERAAEFRHEYYNGRIYAMPGGTFNHIAIISNFSNQLFNAFRKGPCKVLTTDLRVRVAPDGLYTYPDIVVVCGERKFADDHKDTLENPTLIIEVLSPSTEAYDRGFKAVQYRKLKSLQEYALASQSEPRIEIFRRQQNGDWLLSETSGREAICNFASVNCRIALADIYEDILFGSEDSLMARPLSSE